MKRPDISETPTALLFPAHCPMYIMHNMCLYHVANKILLDFRGEENLPNNFKVTGGGTN